jgi:hypothetical protein
MELQYTALAPGFLLTATIRHLTLRGMGGHRFIMLGGAAWSLFRFAVVALLIARLVPGDPLFHIGLLWIGAPSLVMVGLFGGCAFIPRSEPYYVPLLRIGMLLAAAADVIVILTRGYLPPADRAGSALGSLGPTMFVIVYGILAVDLLMLAALLSYPRAINDDTIDADGNDEKEDE